MNRNDFWVLLYWGGTDLLAALIGPYRGNKNLAPKYGRSRNDRIPPSYKQGVAIGATVFAIEALLTFVGVVFFDMLSHRAQQTIFEMCIRDRFAPSRHVGRPCGASDRLGKR